MELIESSETSAYDNTMTLGTYPKEKKLQSKRGESLKSRVCIILNINPEIYIHENIYISKCDFSAAAKGYPKNSQR